MNDIFSIEVSSIWFNEWLYNLVETSIVNIFLLEIILINSISIFPTNNNNYPSIIVILKPTSSL